MLSLATNFPNRIGRAQWWAGVAVAAAVISGGLAIGGENNLIVMLVSAAVSLGIAVLVSIPRLHDRNKSAVGIFYCLAFVTLVAKPLRNLVPDDIKWWTMVALGVGFAIWAVIELGILRGTTGRNPYGPDPLDDTTRTA